MPNPEQHQSNQLPPFYATAQRTQGSGAEANGSFASLAEYTNQSERPEVTRYEQMVIGGFAVNSGEVFDEEVTGSEE